MSLRRGDRSPKPRMGSPAGVPIMKEPAATLIMPSGHTPLGRGGVSAGSGSTAATSRPLGSSSGGPPLSSSGATDFGGVSNFTGVSTLGGGAAVVTDVGDAGAGSGERGGSSAGRF